MTNVASFAYVEPASIEEAVELLAEDLDDSHLLAGGTALVPLLKTGYVRPTRLIGLRGLQSLRSIAEGPDGLSIGALTTLADVAASPIVRDGWPLLAEACRVVGTVRIRNQATIGGNLVHADPSEDPPPALMVLEAACRVRGPDGERVVPLSELFVDYFENSLRPDEILLSVEVPTPPAGARMTYVKFLPRSQDDYATVAAAALVVEDGAGRLDDVRIAVGGVGPRPVRLLPVEDALRGEPLTSTRLRDAAALVDALIDPIDDVRGSAAYKRAMARVWVERTIGDLCGVAVS